MFEKRKVAMRTNRATLFTVASLLALATVQPAAAIDSRPPGQPSGFPLRETPDRSTNFTASRKTTGVPARSALGASIYPVRASRRTEQNGAGSDSHIGWSRAPSHKPNRISAFIQERGGNPKKVNPKGTKAFAGGFDDHLFIYQQVRKGQSNIKLFNLRRNKRNKPPRAVNTKRWEWSPTVSDENIMFGRARFRKKKNKVIEKVLLFDSVNRRTTRLARTTTPDRAIPGQVNGKWAVWNKCRGTSRCDAFRYNIETRTREKIPNTATHVYAPSVMPDGTAYFARSGSTCGSNVRLFERTGGGSEREIFKLDPGWDIYYSHAFQNADGSTTVYFDLTDCDLTINDIYGVDIPDPGSEEPSPSPSPSPTPSAGPDQELAIESSSIAYQADASHSGVLEGAGITPPLAQRWERDMGNQMSYPVVAGGKAFILVRNESAYGTSLHALDLVTGATEWQRGIGGTYYWAAAAYENGVLFVQNFDGTLLALNATDGSTVWAADLPGQYSFSSPPVADEGVVYTGGAGSGGTLYAVNASDGDVLWTRSVSNGSHSSPALSNSKVFVSYSCPNVYAFERSTGHPWWTYSTGCSGGGGRTPVYDSGRVYVRDGTEGLVLDSQTGDVLDLFGAGPIPALDDGDGYFVFGGALEARHPSGVTKWTFTPEDDLVSAPLVVDGHIYVGSQAGTLYVLRPEDGAVISQHPLGEPIAVPDEHNVSRPLSGLGAGEGVLLVPNGTTLTALESE